MARIDVVCRFCGSTEDVRRHGKESTENQRFRCLVCRKTFHLDYYYEACRPGVKDKIVDMAMNNSGIHDTARVLNVGYNTVLHNYQNRQPLFLQDHCQI